jgi:hypothetical protein
MHRCRSGLQLAVVVSAFAMAPPVRCRPVSHPETDTLTGQLPGWFRANADVYQFHLLPSVRLLLQT